MRTSWNLSSLISLILHRLSINQLRNTKITHIAFNLLLAVFSILKICPRSSLKSVNRINKQKWGRLGKQEQALCSIMLGRNIINSKSSIWISFNHVLNSFYNKIEARDFLFLETASSVSSKLIFSFSKIINCVVKSTNKYLMWIKSTKVWTLHSQKRR